MIGGETVSAAVAGTVTARPDAPLLTVTGLVKEFRSRRSMGELFHRNPAKSVRAVDDVTFALRRGQVLGIAGESGSGKSTTARCITRLIEPDAGEIRFDGTDVRTVSGVKLREVRRRVQMVFQDPYASLNPRLSVGRAILEAGKVHHQLAAATPDQFVSEQLDKVRLPRSFAARRPRDLSGGQRQRVAIARAMATGPEIIIADEAVSALDVSIQTEIVNLFLDLRDNLGLSLIFVSHQLPVLAAIADHIAVMRSGAVVEYGTTPEVFRTPKHPYTIALLNAHPSPDAARTAAEKRMWHPGEEITR